jgi:Uncharacterized protein conserved in bacteria
MEARSNRARLWVSGSLALKTCSLAFLSGLLIVPQALAAAALEDSGQRHAPAEQQGVQLAQAYDFDVYIDQYGREIIINPRTGEVVEIRAPYYEPAPPPRTDSWGARRGYYDFSDPRDVERFHRDREAAIRGGWGDYALPEPQPLPPPPSYEPYEDPYDAPDYGYEPDRGYEPDPLFQERRSVERVPLEPPSPGGSDTFAAIPDLGPAQPGQGEQLRQGLPRSPDFTIPGVRGASEEVAAFQVLLDRAGASPGVIDGRIGDNVNKAIDAYHKITGQRLRTYDKAWIEAELEATGGPAFMSYTITPADVAGPYIASVPEDYGEKARLERLSFTRVSEMLAERFHMDENYLLQLNPGANFDRPGTIIKVANPGTPATTPVARIVADKSAKQVRAYDERGRLVAAYPATIGSTDTPSPSGKHEVVRIAFEPNYTYDPKKNFKQGNNDRILTIPPGPNGPVGSVWIALSKPTYGIHGTPEPSKIGKTYSHGCIRLTNWDAEELAKRVKPGVPVEFVE